MHLSRSVPGEVWLEIMGHLADERETLRATIDADCAASFAATRVYWANITSEEGLLDELEEQPDDQRQFYANMIRKIAIDFKPRYSQHEGRGLSFPLLRCLTIVPDKSFGLRPDRTYAKVKRFVGPLLRELDVGCEHYGMHEAITDNFLPRLSTSIGLTSLTIRARVKNAIPQELVLVLQSCQKLRTLSLEEYTEPLVDEDTLEALAQHPLIMSLHLEKRLDRSLTWSIALIAQPFRNVTFLEIAANSAATRLVVSRLQHLEVLHLTATEVVSVFPSLGELQNLKVLWIRFVCYSLTDGDLTHLVPLKQLELLELDGDDGRLVQATSISPDLLAAVLGSLPLLHTFTFLAINNAGDPLLLSLGHACRNLRDLTLIGKYTLEALENETAVLFPHLTSLRLGTLKPSVPIKQYGGFREDWADQRAQDVIWHTPNLVNFSGSEEGDYYRYGNLVEEAWKRLKRDGHLYIGGR